MSIVACLCRTCLISLSRCTLRRTKNIAIALPVIFVSILIIVNFCTSFFLKLLSLIYHKVLTSELTCNSMKIYILLVRMIGEL